MKIVNFFIYGNFLIALCAYMQTVQTCYFLGHSNIFHDNIPVFAAAATFFLYNIHKPITFFLKKQLIENQRYLKTKSFSTPLSILTVLAGLFCWYLFFQIKPETQLSLVFAAVLSLSYVLPIFGGKRLRDLPFIKIFTIAFVWAFVTVILPIQEYGREINITILVIFFEKAFFVFALTIPFDIRDMDWDAKTNVKTIPLSIGVQNAKYLGMISLLVCMILVLILNKQGTYTYCNCVALLLSYFSSALVLYFTKKNRSDYYFYALDDGMMLTQSLLVFIVNSFIL